MIPINSRLKRLPNITIRIVIMSSMLELTTSGGRFRGAGWAVAHPEKMQSEQNYVFAHPVSAGGPFRNVASGIGIGIGAGWPGRPFHAHFLIEWARHACICVNNPLRPLSVSTESLLLWSVLRVAFPRQSAGYPPLRRESTTQTEGPNRDVKLPAH